MSEKKVSITEFVKKGYLMGPSIATDIEINELRNSIKETLIKKSFPRDMSLFEVEDQKTIKTLLGIINSEQLKLTLNEIGNYFNTPISILPPFNIMNNYHVDRINDPGIGWHRDCGGEMQYNYCKEKIYDKSYVFGKIGIYLQSNLEFGGAIDIIPSSHIYIKSKKSIYRKLFNIPLRLIQILQKKFPNYYKKCSESFYMNLYNGKKILPEKGQVVLFDSRISHRGTPIEDSVRNKVLFSSTNYQAKTADQNTKYAIYCHFGSSIGFDSYIYDRIRQDKNENELKRWIYEQKSLEKFFPELALSVKRIIDPIIPKYSNYL
ncbi:hypothetical protein OAJ64_01210 [Pelagibacteraceae bacterium]|nr:hypothetical protein [Pelagibacteraceae bacterium]